MTTSKTTLLITTSMLVLLTACGSSPSSNSPAAPAPVPAAGSGSPANPNGLQYDFRSQVMQATKLNPTQKAELAGLSLTRERYSPNVNLYFDAYPEESEKQQDMARLNDDGVAYVARVKANCTITPGTDQESGDRSVGHIHTSHEARSISGNNCPISYSYDSKTRLETTAFDESTGIMSGKMHTDTIENKQIIDLVMQANIYISSQIVNTSADTLFQSYKSDADGNPIAGSAYFTRKITGTLLLADRKTIHLAGEAEIFKSKDNSQMQSLAKMTLPSGTNVVIGLFQSDGKVDILLNGEDYTPQRFQTEFGVNPGF